MTSIRVASYNIHTAIGVDDRRDIGRVTDVVRRTGADVIGLQEVDRYYRETTSAIDQVQTLADDLIMTIEYSPTVEKPPTAESDGALDSMVSQLRVGTQLTILSTISCLIRKTLNNGYYSRHISTLTVRLFGSSTHISPCPIRHVRRRFKRFSKSQTVTMNGLSSLVISIHDLKANRLRLSVMIIEMYSTNTEKPSSRSECHRSETTLMRIWPDTLTIHDVSTTCFVRQT